MKKIMILMLSLAVLFSFAACDNSSDTPADEPSVGQVTAIYATSIPQYLTGEKIDLADFKLVGEDSNGNVIDIPEDEIVIVDETKLVADNTAGRKTLDLSTAGVTYKNLSIDGLVYDAYAIDAASLKVVGPTANEEYYVKSSTKGFAFNYENYTVTVTYTVNGDKITKTLDPEDDYTATYTDTSAATNVPVTFSTKVGGTAQTDDKTVKVNVIDDPVVGIVAELKETDGVVPTIYSRSAATAVAGGDFTSVINVYEQLKSGYVDESTPLTKTAALVFTPATGLVTGESGSEKYGAADTYAVDVEYTVGSSTYETSANVVVSADVIQKIAAEVRSGSDTATNGVAVGATIDKADIKVTATYASTTTEELASTAFTLDPETMPQGAAGSYNVDVVLNADETITTTVAITVDAD